MPEPANASITVGDVRPAENDSRSVETRAIGFCVGLTEVEPSGDGYRMRSQEDVHGRVTTFVVHRREGVVSVFQMTYAASIAFKGN